MAEQDWNTVSVLWRVRERKRAKRGTGVCCVFVVAVARGSRSTIYHRIKVLCFD